MRVLLCMCACLWRGSAQCGRSVQRRKKWPTRALAQQSRCQTRPQEGARRRRSNGDGTSSADTDMDAPVWRAFPEQSWVPTARAAVVSCFRLIVVFREKPTRGRQRRRSGAREERIARLALSLARRLSLPFSARRVFTARLSATPGNKFLGYAASRTDAPHPSCAFLSLK